MQVGDPQAPTTCSDSSEGNDLLDRSRQDDPNEGYDRFGLVVLVFTTNRTQGTDLVETNMNPFRVHNSASKTESSHEGQTRIDKPGMWIVDDINYDESRCT